MKTKYTTLLTLALGLLLSNPAAATPPTNARGRALGRVAWGDTISKPGTYRLTGDISGDGTAITITADHVILDLNGHTITGDGRHVSIAELASTGILVQGASHVQIMKGTVTGFSYAIRLEAVQHSQVKNCRIVDNFRGVWIRSNSHDNQIKENEVTGHHCCGIRIGPELTVDPADGSSGNSVKDNHCSHNNDGIIVVSCHSNEIKENHLEANLAGINLVGDSNVVSENLAEANMIGIFIRRGAGNVVRENTANNNTYDGPYGGLIHAGIVLGVPAGFPGGPAYATGTHVVGNTAVGHAGPPHLRFQTDVFDNSLFPFNPGHVPTCENTWEENVFVKDNETGADFGPDDGCIQ